MFYSTAYCNYLSKSHLKTNYHIFYTLFITRNLPLSDTSGRSLAPGHQNKYSVCTEPLHLSFGCSTCKIEITLSVTAAR
jgi:hypothetical protein